MTEYTTELNSIEEKLKEMSTLVSRLSEPGTGAFISISSNSAALAPLERVLGNILSKTRKQLSDEFGEKTKEASKETTDELKKQTDAVTHEIKEKKKSDEKQYDSFKALARALHDKIKDNGKDSLTRGEKLVLRLEKIGLTCQLISDFSGKIFQKVSDLATQQINFAADLRSAGVFIKTGFDQSFIKFANEAGLSREGFAEFMKENSRFISSMNAKGINGAEVLAKESRKLLGTMGLTAGEISATTKAYNESMLTTANQASIASIDHTNELMKSTRALKTFAMATGQSVENILKEQKERERTWQMQRLASDPRTRNQLMMMRNAGLSDELIEGIMLGKHNKATTMALLDPNSARMLSSMRQAYMSTMGNPEAFAKAMMALSNSSAAQGMRRSEANMNVMDYAYINGLGELFAPGSTIWGKMTSQTFGNNPNQLMSGTEVDAINAMQNLTANINELKNNFMNALSPSLKTISDWIRPDGVIGQSLKGIAEWVGKNPFLVLSGWVAVTAGKSIGSSFLGSIMQAWAFKKMGIGIGTKTAETMTTVLSGKSGFLGKLAMVMGEGASKMSRGIRGSIAGLVSGLAIRGAANAFGLDTGKWSWMIEAGSGLGGLIGNILFPGVGGILGSIAGGLLGYVVSRFIGGKSDEAKAADTLNSPASSTSISTYNESGESNESSGGVVQPATVNTTYNTVSVIGIDSIRSLLRSIEENTKNTYNEIRNGPYRGGTNLATA